MRIILICIVLFTSASALAGETSKPSKSTLDLEVQAALAKARYNLKDPDSAKFRNLFKYVNSRGFTVVCGEINSKNSYGAYAGFERFAATSAGASYASPNDIASNVLMDTTCVKSVNDSKVQLDANEYK